MDIIYGLNSMPKKIIVTALNNEQEKLLNEYKKINGFPSTYKAMSSLVDMIPKFNQMVKDDPDDSIDDIVQDKPIKNMDELSELLDILKDR